MIPPGQQYHKTRIAPTPSGYLHIGNAFSFALTAALAHHYGAGILLRIDDLDRDRVQKAYVQDIFDTLHFLDIAWQEGPQHYEAYERQYAQAHRMPLYREILDTLAASGAVFACSCSRSQVLQQNSTGVYQGQCLTKQAALTGQDIAWRLNTNEKLLLTVKELNGHTVQAILPETMHYFIVRKKDGYPAYQLASLADDLFFGVDLVVRGADLWDSTLAQSYLAQKLGATAFSNISFYHHPLMQDAHRQKLSKSAGATSIQYLRRQGYTAADVYREMGQMAGIERPVLHWRDLMAYALGSR